ncbi:hypothetical protein MBLNU459_g1827t1 [Dothideomycetes sp. NU459]
MESLSMPKGSPALFRVLKLDPSLHTHLKYSWLQAPISARLEAESAAPTAPPLTMGGRLDSLAGHHDSADKTYLGVILGSLLGLFFLVVVVIPARYVDPVLPQSEETLARNCSETSTNLEQALAGGTGLDGQASGYVDEEGFELQVLPTPVQPAHMVKRQTAFIETPVSMTRRPGD